MLSLRHLITQSQPNMILFPTTMGAIAPNEVMISMPLCLSTLVLLQILSCILCSYAILLQTVANAVQKSRLILLLQGAYFICDSQSWIMVQLMVGLLCLMKNLREDFQLQEIGCSNSRNHLFTSWPAFSKGIFKAVCLKFESYDQNRKL